MSSARTRADVRGRRRLPCKVSFGQHPVIRRKRVCGSGGCNFVWNAWAHSNIKKATTIFHQKEILNIIYIWQIYSIQSSIYSDFYIHCIDIDLGLYFFYRQPQRDNTRRKNTRPWKENFAGSSSLSNPFSVGRSRHSPDLALNLLMKETLTILTRIN